MLKLFVRKDYSKTLPQQNFDGKKNDDNNNKNDTKVSTSNSTEVAETVEKPKNKNVNLNGHLNVKPRLKNVSQQEKVKSNQNKN